MTVAKRFVARGRVQGVGFRWFVIDAAQRLELSGWTRNCGDGSVEVVAQGSADAVASMATLLQKGPRAARVESVTASDIEPDERLVGFQVTY